VVDALKQRIRDPGNFENVAVIPGAIILDLGAG
jgi:hypothetical protein